ncbi:MAG: CHAD domain-containing protein [Allosphingosinicella sp.]
MGNEVELKLDLMAEAAAALEATPWAGDAKVAKQISIYFDTPDLALSKAGISLRIRRSGGKRIQTVKADGAGAAGLFVRSEWERPVTDDVPVLDDTTPVRALLGDAVNGIGPTFEVRVERRSWMVHQDDAVIELVLDRGEAVAGERSTRICEIELELQQGDPSALFAFARRIDAIAPVRLGVQTKAERGYRLLGPAARLFKAEPVALASDMTAAEAFRQIVQSCLRQFRLNEGLLLVSPDAGSLHQARVALRRLRSAFSIFKQMIDESGSAALRAELRWLASELGEARDLDVLLERAPPGDLRAKISAAHDAAYGRVAEVLASTRVRVLMLDLTEWTLSGDWLSGPGTARDRDMLARDFAAAALDRFRRKVKKGGRGLARVDDELRHEVRKDAKKLRYASEFFARLFASKREQRRHRKFVAALEQLQDQLGALNDLATVPPMLDRIGGASDPQAAALLAADKRETLLERAEHAHEDLVDMKRFWR